MGKIPALQIDNDSIANLVRQAVNDRHMTLSEIAARGGLSVSTLTRIYHGSKNQVHMTTARRIAEALDYEVRTFASGKVGFEPVEGKQKGNKLTGSQIDMIVKAVERTLRVELRKIAGLE